MSALPVEPMDEPPVAWQPDAVKVNEALRASNRRMVRGMEDAVLALHEAGDHETADRLQRDYLEPF